MRAKKKIPLPVPAYTTAALATNKAGGPALVAAWLHGDWAASTALGVISAASAKDCMETEETLP